MSVRRIGINRQHVTGFFASRKMGRMVAFESPLERDYFACLEFDPAVASFEEQPVAIPFMRGRHRFVHTPDVLVCFDPTSAGKKEACPLLVQVKDRLSLLKRWGHFHAPLLAASRYAKQRGWKFRIVTDVEIRSAYLRNARRLLPFLDRDIEMADAELVLSQFGDSPKAIKSIVATLENCGKERGWALSLVWGLLARRILTTDLSKDLTLASEVAF